MAGALWQERATEGCVGPGSVDQRAHTELPVNLAVLSSELSGVEVARAEAGSNKRREATSGQKSPAVPGSKSVFHDFLPKGR